MSTPIPYVITNRSLTLVPEGLMPITIHNDHPNWDRARDEVKKGNFNDAITLMDIPKAITDYTSASGVISIENGHVLYKDEPIHNYVTDKIIQMMEQGFQIEPLVNFLENLMENPSYRAIQELYGFLEYGGMPITPDGHFLAYKRIKDDYTDVHSGTIDNSVGQVVTMHRAAVDDDSNNTCSSGLHACSFEYVSNFSGARLVIVKINPRDVVSIPQDYNNTKLRCCRYEVMSELEDMYKEPETFTNAVVESDGSQYAMHTESEDERQLDLCDICFDEPCTCDDETTYQSSNW